MSLRTMAPCQSLGIFYIQPTPVAIKFLAYLSAWIRETHPSQWDQAAWNEVRPARLAPMCRAKA